MRLRTIIAAALISIALSQRPYNITAIRYGTNVQFDNGECGIPTGTPHVGPIGSFWHAYWSTEFPFWHPAGFTQDDIGYTFVSSFC